ncbi:GTP-binding protein [Polaribacter sp. Z014]|uniref:GTP-binding protein n=1 Tax=Polaribacter sp. Z014 TaxID=2927126 RepID=UPI0020212828|nr:GTP-binding protein [Polaribacter sp. Z014]MCL7762483.1 GTP-binding protein [Polaribacter sp. Z014]
MNVQEKRNSDFFLRPRFSIDIKENPDELLQRITTYLKSDVCKYRSRVAERHVFIDIPVKKSHFWSPQLHFEVEKVDENSSTLKGLFGPKPQVWTLFMFVHFVVATLFLGFAVFAYVKHRLGESLIFPIAILVALPLIWLLLYFLGSIGKETGKGQMKELHDLLITIIEQ